MLLPAETVNLTQATGSSTWPMLLTSVAALAAMLITCVRQALAIVKLREKVAALDESRSPGPAASVRIPRSSRQSGPMFVALYPERANPFDRFREIPGAMALGAALCLSLLALGLTAARVSRSDQARAVDRQEIAVLRDTIDSLTGSVRQLGDSIQLTMRAQPAAQPPPGRAVVARRETTRRPDAVLPAPRIAPPAASATGPAIPPPPPTP